MHKGIIVYIIVLIALVIVAYIYTGFKLPPIITSSSIATTTISHATSATTTATTTANYSYIYPCQNFQIYLIAPNTTQRGLCSWSGGTLGIWLAGGNYGAHVSIVGVNNVTYFNGTAPYSCLSFIDNFSAPAQNYKISISTGGKSASCGYSIVKLNTTTVPPKKYYQYIYNGAFSNGKYTGWNVSGKGFGLAPLNITYADAHNCYLGQPWANYNGTFFATTYNCGLTNAPGNLTSAPFIANFSRPFLNFRIISPAEGQLYVEVLQNGTPAIVAHFNTFNVSSQGNAQATFQNASIPLTPVIGKIVQVRVVAQVLQVEKFIAVGDFSLSSKPISAPGILVNMSIA
ncbi:MAG: hypothetical protein M1360_01860 [Candidatus Marsarchaeota archaeon]|nr:hypothetical protein [Candidatus Marsarchaeota archaeon]MCL5418666.1 hypothetical protein [Candidatus Marsarchaeota archaeon]